MNNNKRKSVAVILDNKENVFQRKPFHLKFTQEDIELMLGGEYVLTKLNVKELLINDFIILNPCMFCRKDANQIPLLPNIHASKILKSIGIIDYPLGNVVFINKKKLENGIK